MIAIFHPDGTVAAGFVAEATRGNRRRLRRGFAATMREKWHALWMRGYRLRSLA